MDHPFSFDPTYGYRLPQLLAVPPPAEPPDFAAFWTQRYVRALQQVPEAQLTRSAYQRQGFRCWDLHYPSTDGVRIGGWLLEPEGRPPTLGVVMGHGYGGIEQPDVPLPCADAVYLVPCFRGISRSRCPGISDNPAWHVLNHIDDVQRYVLGGCVEDLWLAVSVLLLLHPQLAGRVGYMGVSFGGGLGALALPWDARISRAHLNVPTFGHQPLRLQLQTLGSGAAVQAYARRHCHVLATLAYYDAAAAARHIRQPMHIAAALFDPAVAPPCQFAVYNALTGPKQLFVLQAGHFDHPGQAQQEQELLQELREFFGCDESDAPQLVQPPSGA